MRLIHLTDLHLSSLEDESVWRLRGKRRLGYLSWYRKRRHIHRREVFERLLEAIAGEGADHILISGDLVQIGLPAEIAAVRRWLQRLGPPEAVTLVPGNHDLYARDSWPEVREHWGDYLHLPRSGGGPQDGYPVAREDDELALFALSSACPTAALMASGRLGAAQLQRLRGQLRRSAAGERFRCLLLHHPPLPGMVPERKALSDAAALKKILGAGGVQLVLHGHVHRNCERRCGDTMIFGTASASSADAAHPAAYRRFDIQADGHCWRVRMCLKSMPPGRRFPGTAAESTWQVPRAG